MGWEVEHKGLKSEMPVLVMTDGVIIDRPNLALGKSERLQTEIGKWKKEPGRESEMQFPCHSQLNQ